MKRMICGVALVASVACNRSLLSNDGVNSEIATSVVSGALNNTGGGQLGWNAPKVPFYRRFLKAVNPIQTARAAVWSCRGGVLSKAFFGAAENPYFYAPPSCTIDWDGFASTSSWTSTFILNYGSDCDTTNAYIGEQVGNCSVTRTTAIGGNTRLIEGPTGNEYRISHDTNGAGTGWNPAVMPAPTNTGVVVTCAASGCPTGGATVMINGSHLVATVTPPKESSTEIWNHTLTTATPLNVTLSNGERVVNGSITLQHNLARYVATTTFNNATYSDVGCCFPTSGSVTTAFQSGIYAGKSETMTFSSSCGEATLTTVYGVTEAYPLMHCM